MIDDAERINKKIDDLKDDLDYIKDTYRTWKILGRLLIVGAMVVILRRPVIR